MLSQSRRDAFATIAIPTALHREIEEHIKGTEFDSVSAYVIFVLRELLLDDDSGQPLSPEDEQKVKEQLRSLGYID